MCSMREKTLLFLTISAHNYDQARRQLSSKNTAAHECLELNEEPQTSPCDTPKSTPLSFVPCIAFKQMTLALDEAQQKGILLQSPALLCGPPGAGKTVLLYNVMLRSIDSVPSQDEVDITPPSTADKVSEQALPTLFISQSEHSVHILKTLYQDTPESATVPVLFTTWGSLLQSQNPDLNLATTEQFAKWLKEKLRLTL